MGTRSNHIEKYLKREKPHKHLILLLNKCDLVPTWVTVRFTFLPVVHGLAQFSSAHISIPVLPLVSRYIRTVKGPNLPVFLAYIVYNHVCFLHPTRHDG